MKKVMRNLCALSLNLSAAAFAVQGLALTADDLVGNWFSACNPTATDGSGKQSGTTIFNADGTWRTVEIIYLDSGCQVIHQVANFSGTYTLKDNRFVRTIADWTMTPLTQERVDFLNAKANCGITDWAVGQTPRVTAGSQCQVPPGAEIEAEVFLKEVDGVVYMLGSASGPTTPEDLAFALRKLKEPAR